MEDHHSLQGTLLEELQHAAVPVSVYLVNGARLQGTIVGSDAYVILLRGPTTITQLVFKHAVLSIMPS